MNEADFRFLEHAAQLSRHGMEGRKGGPFGAIVVKDGTIVAEGWNQVTSYLDPTAHAEIVAIRNACAALGTFVLEGATIYSSCEPCPMCLGAIYWARVGRLVFANTREQAAEIGFDDDWLYKEVPKPLAERLIPTIHAPHAGAAAVFKDWITLPDKVPY